MDAGSGKAFELESIDSSSMSLCCCSTKSWASKSEKVIGRSKNHATSMICWCLRSTLGQTQRRAEAATTGGGQCGLCFLRVIRVFRAQHIQTPMALKTTPLKGFANAHCHWTSVKPFPLNICATHFLRQNIQLWQSRYVECALTNYCRTICVRL